MLQGEPSLSADVAGVSQVPVQALHATYVTLLSPTHGQRMEVAHFVVRCLSGEVRAYNAQMETVGFSTFEAHALLMASTAAIAGWIPAAWRREARCMLKRWPLHVASFICSD